MQIVPYQEELRPELPTVVGNVDYQEFRATLLRIEEILEQSGLERQWISESLDQYQSKAQLVGRQKVSQKELTRIAKHAVLALRCNIVRQLTGDHCCPNFRVCGHLDPCKSAS